MITLHAHRFSLTKRTLITATLVATLTAAIATSISLTRPASALDCVRAPHTIEIVSAQAQSATPGSTVNYHLDITNNDSAGCGSSVFTFSTTDGAAVGWTVAPANGTQNVDYLEKTGYSIWYTVPTNAYNGTYDHVVSVSRAEEPTVTTTALRTTVVGGQNQPVAPTPDTTAPTVTITSPTNGSTVKKNSTVTISASASDNVAVTTIEFYVNGTLLSSGTAPSYAWKVPNTRASHTITVKAYDAAGNVTTKTSSVLSR